MGFRCLTHLGPWENLHPGLVLAPCIAIGVNFSTANAFHCRFVCCRYREAIKKPRVLKSITIDQFRHWPDSSPSRCLLLLLRSLFHQPLRELCACPYSTERASSRWEKIQNSLALLSEGPSLAIGFQQLDL